MTNSFKNLICISFFVLTGCTTTTYHQENVSPVPEDRIYALQEEIPNSAIVRVTRLNNFGASACYMSFLIDDKLVARMGMEEQAFFYIPEGLHKFQNTHDWNGKGLCGAASEEFARNHGQIRVINLLAGKIYDFKIGFNSWGGVFRLYADPEGKAVISENID